MSALLFFWIGDGARAGPTLRRVAGDAQGHAFSMHCRGLPHRPAFSTILVAFQLCQCPTQQVSCRGCLQHICTGVSPVRLPTRSFDPSLSSGHSQRPAESKCKRNVNINIRQPFTMARVLLFVFGAGGDLAAAGVALHHDNSFDGSGSKVSCRSRILLTFHSTPAISYAGETQKPTFAHSRCDAGNGVQLRFPMQPLPKKEMLGG